MKQWDDISSDALVRLLAENQVTTGQIIDVREVHEWNYYHLDGSMHVPMSVLPDRLDSLPKGERLYIMCAHGVRSVAVCNYMNDNGYDNLRNVAGGIAAVAELRGFQYD